MAGKKETKENAPEKEIVETSKAEIPEKKEKKSEAKAKKEQPEEKKEKPEKAEAKTPPEKAPVKGVMIKNMGENDVQITEEDNDERQTSLVPTEKYLNTGAHIGTKFKSGDMKKYIYKVRRDGLNVLDVQVLDERLNFASKFLAKYPLTKIVVVSRKVYGITPAKSFAEAIGAKALTGRFVPGTFTNPECTHFVEPAVVIVTDPEIDNQAVEEATKIRVPVVAMASTNNALKNIDICVPINNKGKKSLALGYWILAKEILKEKGEIKADSEFSKQAEDFEYKMTEASEDERKAFQKKPRRFGNNRRTSSSSSGPSSSNPHRGGSSSSNSPRGRR